MGAYQNDKQRWNFCLSIDVNESSRMTFGNALSFILSPRMFLPFLDSE
jgi:hypothetical protein